MVLSQSHEICNFCSGTPPPAEDVAQIQTGAKPQGPLSSTTTQTMCACLSLNSLTAEDVRAQPELIQGLFQECGYQWEVQLKQCSVCALDGSDNKSDGICDVESETSRGFDQAPDQLCGNRGYHRSHGSNLRTVAPSMSAHLEMGLATSSSVPGMRDSANPPAPSVSAPLSSVVKAGACRGVTHRSWGGPRVTSQFFEEVVKWAREKPKIDVFAAGRQSMCSRSWGRQTDPFEQPRGAEMLFLLPQERCYRRVIDKTLLEGARGILLVPVTKEASWYWALGELAVDWWDVPADTPMFADSQGRAVSGEDHRQWRVVLFHAAEPEDHCSVPRHHRRAVKSWIKLRDNRDIRAFIEADREDRRCRVFSGEVGAGV